ncbi:MULTISPECIES: DUF1361 domain-containing protein [unclassified Treponema]|uniref:DUF1361 domain-containing protein n=1 Tax=unclassified Treponema TaxID=2638727 RepID=UPI0020A616C8|nr:MULTISPECIES: DUF1361 domain-containing protein [unclassified Treponema]UTC67520.1 DUF1361 domain-containing protein [Treponema sp. OMZ 789]UTC70248.1 DUF1361 domain-containing protein [Treponema sp. OMZ 790]UTC72963.1 DUF1361 domain-containing protein [Treponema sp. OMZ 791]
MSRYFKNIFRIKSTFALMFLSFFCIFLSVCRIFIAENYFLLFLVWNLFLAFVPWLISSILYLSKNINKAVFIFFAAFWLLFFPNALYIVTDFIHLKTAASTMRWYDLILLFSYSFTGLFYGFISLDFIETKIKNLFKLKYPQIFSIIVIYLSAFGIYLGRFLRRNSWDVVTNLNSILSDLFLPIKNPFIHARTWAFILLLGTLFNLLYISYKSFDEKKI